MKTISSKSTEKCYKNARKHRKNLPIPKTVCTFASSKQQKQAIKQEAIKSIEHFARVSLIFLSNLK
ncbi:MAG: hypothetical protein IJP70_03750 [Bacteroidales bacterium]|nr:hypothetical protein [Bacteroidales bacterium]